MASTHLSYQSKSILLFGFAWLAMLPLLPLLPNALPDTLDYLNHVAGIVQANMAFNTGEFPIRVVPTPNGAWEYPLFQFYGATSYFIAGIIYHWLTPENPFIAFKIILWCALFIGCVYMYKLAYWLVASRRIALLASIAYIMSPYLLITIDHTGAFNEALALGIIPFVVYSTLQRFYHPEKNIFLIQTALAWYLLATVHLITFLGSSCFIFLFISCSVIRDPKQISNLLRVCLAYLFAILMAFWYLAPIVYMSKYLRVTSASNNIYFSPSLDDLLSPTPHLDKSLAYLDPNINIIELMHPAIGLPILLAVSLGIYFLFCRKKICHATADYWGTPLITLFLFGFLLAWKPMSFWHVLPPSFKVLFQFSGRIVGEIGWIGALLFACAMKWFFQDKISYKQTGLVALFIFLTTWTWLVYTGKKVSNFQDDIPLRISSEYFIDFTKTPKLINYFDTMLIDSSEFHQQLTLQTLKPLEITPAMFNAASSPYIILKGTAPEGIARSTKLHVVVNHSIKLAFDLKPGTFDFVIPLKQKYKISHSLLVEFNLSKTNIPIAVNEIDISGFLDPRTVMSVTRSEPGCRKEGANTICESYVAPNFKLLELPVYYYPNLLSITLNGESIAYNSVLYKDQLITAIIPKPGKLNIIKIKFIGLLWANYISTITWILWLSFLALLSLTWLTTLLPSFKRDPSV
jgi:hypothetical protein